MEFEAEEMAGCVWAGAAPPRFETVRPGAASAASAIHGSVPGLLILLVAVKTFIPVKPYGRVANGVDTGPSVAAPFSDEEHIERAGGVLAVLDPIGQR